MRRSGVRIPSAPPNPQVRVCPRRPYPGGRSGNSPSIRTFPASEPVPRPAAECAADPGTDPGTAGVVGARRAPGEGHSGGRRAYSRPMTATPDAASAPPSPRSLAPTIELAGLTPIHATSAALAGVPVDRIAAQPATAASTSSSSATSDPATRCTPPPAATLDGESQGMWRDADRDHADRCCWVPSQAAGEVSSRLCRSASFGRWLLLSSWRAPRPPGCGPPGSTCGSLQAEWPERLAAPAPGPVTPGC